MAVPVITVGRIEPEVAEAGARPRATPTSSPWVASCWPTPTCRNLLAAGRVDDVRPVHLPVPLHRQHLPERAGRAASPTRPPPTATRPDAAADRLAPAGAGGRRRAGRTRGRPGCSPSAATTSCWPRPATALGGALEPGRPHRRAARPVPSAGRSARSTGPPVELMLGTAGHAGHRRRARASTRSWSPPAGAGRPADAARAVSADADRDRRAPVRSTSVASWATGSTALVADADELVGHDVVVLGGGKVGMSFAGLCARRGRSVTVLEPGRRARPRARAAGPVPPGARHRAARRAPRPRRHRRRPADVDRVGRPLRRRRRSPSSARSAAPTARWPTSSPSCSPRSAAPVHVIGDAAGTGRPRGRPRRRPPHRRAPLT